MDLMLCYNTFKFKKGQNLTQTFTIYKALMNELVNDIKLSKLKINTGFINGLPKKWLSFCQILRNTTAFFSTSIVQDFQNSPDDEDYTRSSHEYLNNLEEEYQARALLAKSKIFFKKGTQRFSSAKVTDQTKCHKCGKKGHFARECCSKTPVLSYQSPFQPKHLSSSQHKPDLRPTKYFEAKYNKVKAKLALLSSSASASKASMVKNKGLIAEAYERDEEEVSSDDNEMVEVKVLMALAEDNDSVSKKGARNGEWAKISMRKKILGVDQLIEDPFSSGKKGIVFVKSSGDDTKVSIPGVKRPWLSEAKGFILPNPDTTNESSVCSTPLPPLKKLDGAEPVSGSKTIKSILRSKSTFKAETLKGVIINEPSSAPTRGNKSSSALKVNSAPAGKLKIVKIEDDPPLTIVIKELNDLILQISKNQSSYSKNNQPQRGGSSRSRTPRPSKYFFPACIHCGFSDHLSNNYVNYPICDVCGSYDHDTHGHNMIISLRIGIKPRIPQHVMKSCKTYGSTVHTITDHDDIEWFRRGEALQAKKAEALKSTKVESSNANNSKTPTKSQDLRWCLEMTLHGQLKVMALSNVMFDEKKRTIFNSNKEVVMIAPRVHLGILPEKENQAPKTIMSFIKRVKNQNNIKVKQLRTDNGTEFRTNILVNFYDEKGNSQNFSSPYTPEQNGVAKKKNKTLIEAARTMLLGSVFSKQYWTEAVATTCYTQNRSIIVKRHLKTPYEIFRKRFLNINFLHVFGCPVYIHNHKDHLGKFDEKVDDGYFLGYSLVSKAFRVVNTRRQQTEEIYHITFDKSPDAIKFTKPLVDNINIAESERYPPNELLIPTSNGS
uniref:Retrovirus-related Pol polyprotein from transposon TNT 1-94 n=1 Tax=Tanacetum cinerariifolium TaxID=118510 RepID=A0A6L2J1G5_TANCI|nr:retrovirus-related Pol polyprotein from transposon TNT 1-94 [Tanacetum cinerariifolium]